MTILGLGLDEYYRIALFSYVVLVSVQSFNYFRYCMLHSGDTWIRRRREEFNNLTVYWLLDALAVVIFPIVLPVAMLIYAIYLVAQSVRTVGEKLAEISDTKKRNNAKHI